LRQRAVDKLVVEVRPRYVLVCRIQSWERQFSQHEVAGQSFRGDDAKQVPDANAISANAVYLDHGERSPSAAVKQNAVWIHGFRRRHRWRLAFPGRLADDNIKAQSAVKSNHLSR